MPRCCEPCHEKVNHDRNLDEAGCCGSKIVKIAKPWHICMFLMGFNQPGAAAWWSACCCHKEHDDHHKCIYGNLVYGVIQEATSIILIGWLLSMATGVDIYRKSK